MNIFNSLGSNYSFDFALKTLLATNDPKHKENLEKYLSERYGGQVFFFYKAREAIFVALQSLRLPKGSGMAINGYTCYAVYKAVVDAGLKPVYLDVPSKGLNFTADQLSEALESQNIKAVIIQNTLGYVCDIESIAQVCREKDLVLIEDLAHSIGSHYKNGTEAGTVGDFTVLSFSQDKVVDAVSGGALVIRNKKFQVGNLETVPVSKSQQKKDRWYPDLTQKIRNNYTIGLGKFVHWFYKTLGWLPSPMEGLEQIVLRELPNWYCGLVNMQFANLDKNLQHKKEIAEVCAANLDPSVQLPNIAKLISTGSNLRFPILVKNRESLIEYLKKFGVHVSDIWYDAPIGPKKFMERTDYKGQCKNAESLSAEMVNLPTHIHVSVKQTKEICEKINTWLKSQ